MSVVETIKAKIWRTIALRKLNSNKKFIQVEAILVLGRYGLPEDIEVLLPFLEAQDNLLRLNATIVIRKLFKNDPEKQAKDLLVNTYRQAKLLQKITIIEILQELPLEEREQLFGDQLASASDDLLYALLQALKGTTDIDLLDIILESANTRDLILRRTAYHAWFAGIEAMEKEKRLEYATPRLHQLIRATYENRDDGRTLNYVLGHSNRRDLPEPKAYPEFIIRYLIELINTWEYDPDVNRAIHALVVPAYFTFREEHDMKDRPYIQI
ncbi:MAG: hypothetical protein D6732_19070 [Methanobacteriota archaeon]|nr:MAG: hypothetical protein D6732_19070 [Euryarchaeota archaeon]